MKRRQFLKVAAAGGGALIASSLFHDRLLAGAGDGAGAGTLVPSAQAIADRFGVSREEMARTLAAALSKGGDYADLFFEYKLANALVMEDEIIKESSEAVILGVGIHVLAGKQTGYAHTSELTPAALQQAALTAAAIAAAGAKPPLPPLAEAKLARQSYDLAAVIAEAPLADKIALVKEAYAAALAHDRRITKVVVDLADELQVVTIATSEGVVVSDRRPQVRLVVRATAEDKGVRNTGRGDDGGRVGMAFFRSGEHTPKAIGVRAAAEAITLLSAVNADPGDQPVVLGKNNSGVMIHEAVGHPLEADGAWQKSSVMHDRLGQMVASPSVTIYDDATLASLRGSLNVDDEGMPTANVMLIERGKLVGFLHDRLSARMLGVKPNGHARRESYRFAPIPRMNNTMLARGDADPEEIVRSVKRGIYAESYQGGMVQGTGKFTFSLSLGYRIENGKLTAPVKNATLIGTNVDILKRIEMVGNDGGIFRGTCGKGGQSATVTAGTPTLKLREMTVGGRA